MKESKSNITLSKANTNESRETEDQVHPEVTWWTKAPCLFQKKKRRRGSKEVEACVFAPLATEDPIDHLDGVQEENQEEEEMMRISPRSDSPRGQFLLVPCSGNGSGSCTNSSCCNSCHGSSSHSNSSCSNSGQSLLWVVIEVICDYDVNSGDLCPLRPAGHPRGERVQCRAQLALFERTFDPVNWGRQAAAAAFLKCDI